MSAHKDHFINQQWRTGTGAPFTSRNPANEEILWQGNAAGQTEVQDAVKAAREALPSWAELSLDKRKAYLETFRQILNSEIAHFSEIISKETGKPLWESKTEVQAMINKVAISIDAYQERCPETVKEGPAGRIVRRHKPHGVITVFGPFNFPAHLPNGHIIPSLLAGNCIVFKPSELAPLTAETMIHYWEQSHLPPGVINMVQGGRTTGQLVAGQKGIDGLFFTGSWATGLMLSEQFAKHPDKILALEMGGNNPLIVDELSDHNAAAYMTIQSAFLTAGQRCSCARRLIVPIGKQGDRFIQTLVEMIQKIHVGPYTDNPEPFMGPVITESAARHFLAVQEAFKSKGGDPLVEMRLLKLDSALLSPGLMDVTKVLNRPDEELFGPFLQVIRVPDFNAAIEEANNTSYGLTAGLLSTNADHYQTFYQRIRAGVINWNTPLTGASSALPFGGIGRSGNHRPSAYYAADYCSYPVASTESPEIKLPETLTPGIKM